MESKKEFKIYSLNHPVSNEIRYIGVTSRKLSQRLSQHISLGRKDIVSGSLPISKWINSLLKLNLKPVITLIEMCNETNWQSREIYWINNLKKNSKLLNLDNGGKGVIVGKTRDIANINVVEAHKVKIVQFTQNGEFIKIWNSIKEATDFYGFKTRAIIGNAINDKYVNSITGGGYKWQKYSDYVNGISLKSHVPKIGTNTKGLVYMFDFNGKLVKTFNSGIEASIYLDVYPSSIFTAIKSNGLCKNHYFSRDLDFKVAFKFKIININTMDEYRCHNYVECTKYTKISLSTIKNRLSKHNELNFKNFIIQKI